MCLNRKTYLKKEYITIDSFVCFTLYIRGMAVSSSTAALLLRRPQLPAKRLPNHRRKHCRTSQNLAAIRALLYDAAAKRTTIGAFTALNRVQRRL